MNINKRGVASIAAGTAIAAVLVSGSTTALWSQDINLDSATITSGNLAVASLATMAWTDESADGATPGSHAINPATDKIVPGDVWKGSQELDVALEGDNMQATFTFSNSVTGALLSTSGDCSADGAGEGICIKYSVFDESGTAVITDQAVNATAANAVVNLLPSDVTADLDGTADYRVDLTVTFDPDTPDRNLADGVQADLAQMGIALNQTR